MSMTIGAKAASLGHRFHPAVHDCVRHRELGLRLSYFQHTALVARHGRAVPHRMFIESIVSASLIVLVVRSRRPFFKSRPSKLLMLATAAIALVTALTPHLPFAGMLGFQPMPAHFHPIIALIVVAYIVAAELAKLLFYRTNRRSLFAKTYACDINE
jgi:hypothetical protein